MTTGQKYLVKLTFRNTGRLPWFYWNRCYLVSQNPPNNKVWSINRVNLSIRDFIFPGRYKIFIFTVTAPNTPGTYNFQWQMCQERKGPFGQKSPNIAIVVKPFLALNPIGDKSTYEDKLLEFKISAQGPPNLTFSASNLPQGAIFNSYTQTFSWLPAHGQAGIYPDIRFEVKDTAGNTSSSTITGTVLKTIVFGTIYEKNQTNQLIGLEGVTIQVLDITRTNVLAEGITGTTGHFDVYKDSWPDGNYFIKASKSGFKTYWGLALIRANTMMPFSITMQKVILYGIISELNSQGQTVLSQGAKVEILDLTKTNVLAAATTVQNGSFEIVKDFFQTGDYIIRITKSGFETLYKKINIPYNQPIELSTMLIPSPALTITEPASGAIFNDIPIRVSGNINSSIVRVFIDDTYNAIIQSGAYFCEYVDLKEGTNIINVKAYNSQDAYAEAEVSVTSNFPTQFELTKLTPDYNIFDSSRPLSGSNIDLGVKLIIDNLPKQNEPIKFEITQGGGTLLSATVSTNETGEAHTTLTLDTNASVQNTIKAYDQNYPQKSVEFSISAKSSSVANLVKITDELILPCPDLDYELAVKLQDQNNNPINGEIIDFEILSGGGVLLFPEDTASDYGRARTILHTPNSSGITTVVTATSASNPLSQAIFTITTSDFSPFTPDEIMARVQANDSLIQDVKADIHVTSNAPWDEPISDLKIWIKGKKQKVKEISPNSGIYIRPVKEGTVNFDKRVMFYDTSNGIYTIKLKQAGQAEEYPYFVQYIDYNKGVIVKSEFYILQDNFRTVNASEYKDFIQIQGAWGYQAQTDKVYGKADELLYTTTKTYSNIQINTEIPDSEFQP